MCDSTIETTPLHERQPKRAIHIIGHVCAQRSQTPKYTYYRVRNVDVDMWQNAVEWPHYNYISGRVRALFRWHVQIRTRHSTERAAAAVRFGHKMWTNKFVRMALTLVAGKTDDDDDDNRARHSTRQHTQTCMSNWTVDFRS